MREVLTAKYQQEVKSEKLGLVRQISTYNSEQIKLSDAALRTLILAREACIAIEKGLISDASFSQIIGMINSSPAYRTLASDTSDSTLHRRMAELSAQLSSIQLRTANATRLDTADYRQIRQLVDGALRDADSLRHANLDGAQLDTLGNTISSAIGLRLERATREVLSSTGGESTDRMTRLAIIDSLRGLRSLVQRVLDRMPPPTSSPSPPATPTDSSVLQIVDSVMVVFQEGTSQLEDDAFYKLSRLYPYQGRSLKFGIVAATSLRDHEVTNGRLSEARAVAVQRWLVGVLKVPPNDIRIAALESHPPLLPMPEGARAVVYVMDRRR